MNCIGKLLTSVLAIFFGVLGWSLFLQTKMSLAVSPPVFVALAVGAVSAAITVFSTRRAWSTGALGFLGYLTACELFALTFLGAPFFAIFAALALLAMVGMLPFLAGWLVGYWVALGVKIASLHVRLRQLRSRAADKASA